MTNEQLSQPLLEGNTNQQSLITIFNTHLLVRQLKLSPVDLAKRVLEKISDAEADLSPTVLGNINSIRSLNSRLPTPPLSKKLVAARAANYGFTACILGTGAFGISQLYPSMRGDSGDVIVDDILPVIGVAACSIALLYFSIKIMVNISCKIEDQVKFESRRDSFVGQVVDQIQRPLATETKHVLEPFVYPKELIELIGTYIVEDSALFAPEALSPAAEASDTATQEIEPLPIVEAELSLDQHEGEEKKSTVPAETAAVIRKTFAEAQTDTEYFIEGGQRLTQPGGFIGFAAEDLLRDFHAMGRSQIQFPKVVTPEDAKASQQLVETTLVARDLMAKVEKLVADHEQKNTLRPDTVGVLLPPAAAYLQRSFSNLRNATPPPQDAPIVPEATTSEFKNSSPPTYR